jgi:hypothetical protein
MRLTASNIMQRAWNMFVPVVSASEENLLAKDDFRKLENDLAYVMAQLLSTEVGYDAMVVANTPLLYRRCKALAYFFIEECCSRSQHLLHSGRIPELDQNDNSFSEFLAVGADDPVLEVWAALLYEMQDSLYASINIQRNEVLESITNALDGSHRNSNILTDASGFINLLFENMSDVSTLASIETKSNVITYNTLNESEFDTLCTLLETCLKLKGLTLMEFNGKKFEDTVLDLFDLRMIESKLRNSYSFTNAKNMEHVKNKNVALYGSVEKNSRIIFRITAEDKTEVETNLSASIEVMIALFDSANTFKSYGFTDLNVLTTEYRRSVIEKLDSAVFVNGIYQE